MIYDYILSSNSIPLSDLETSVRKEKSSAYLRGLLKRAIAKLRKQKYGKEVEKVTSIVKIVSKYIDMVVEMSSMHKQLTLNQDTEVVDYEDMEIDEAWQMLISKIQDETEASDEETQKSSERSDLSP